MNKGNLSIAIKDFSFNMIKVEKGTFLMGSQNNNPSAAV